jgi:hypothetical protein
MIRPFRDEDLVLREAASVIDSLVLRAAKLEADFRFTFFKRQFCAKTKGRAGRL